MLAERNSLAAIHRIKGIKEETVTILSHMYLIDGYGFIRQASLTFSI
jgi:hypothetical protein